MKSNEELFKELQAKLDKEYEDLTNEVIKLKPRDIINRSYEFVIKEEIKDLYFDNKDLERYDIKALLSLDNTLDYLYNSWICTDFQINNEIRDALEDEVMELSKVFINKNLEKCKNKDKYIIIADVIEQLNYYDLCSNFKEKYKLSEYENMSPLLIKEIMDAGETKYIYNFLKHILNNDQLKYVASKREHNEELYNNISDVVLPILEKKMKSKERNDR